MTLAVDRCAIKQYTFINIVWYIVCVCPMYLYIILLTKGSVLFCSIIYHRNTDRGLALNKLSSSDMFRIFSPNA